MRTLAAAVWLCPRGRTARFGYTSADRCLSLQLAAAFVVQPPAEGPPMTMTTIAPPRPAAIPGLPVRLTASPAAVAEARRQVRAALDLWRAPVDPDIAVLLASDLVTNAIRHQPGGTITLGVRCVAGHLRVDVRGSAVGPDLILVRTLSDDWGCYPTPAGQAVYFTLAFSSDGWDA